MAKFCQNCGAPLPEAGKFCIRCGTPIPQAASPEPVPAPQPVQPPVQPPVQQPMQPPWYPPTQPQAPTYPQSPVYPGAGVPGQYMPPQKKSNGGLIIGIVAAVLVVALGVVGYFGLRDGGFLRGQGGTTEPTYSTRTTTRTKKTKTTRTTEATTTTETTTTTTATTTTTTAASLDIDAVVGTYEFEGDYHEYFGETIVDSGSTSGTLTFSKSGSDLVMAISFDGGGGGSFTLSYDPDNMEATYYSATESEVDDFSFEFYEASGKMCVEGFIVVDYPYSDIPSDAYYFDGTRK